MKSDISAYKSFIEAEKGQLINSNDLVVQEVKKMQQNQLNSDQQIKELSKELGEYKKIQSYVKAEILSEIKDIEIPYKYINTNVYLPDTGCIDVDIVRDSFVPMGSKVEFNDRWVSFSGTVGKQFNIDSLSMLNKLDVTIGYEKSKWYKKAEPTVTLNSYSPYSSVPYMNNLIVKEPKGRFIKKLVFGSILFSAGAVTNKIITNGFNQTNG